MKVTVSHPFFTAAAVLLLCFFDYGGTAISCLIALTVHEVAHGLVFSACTGQKPHFTVSVGGIMLHRERTFLSSRQELAVLAAGPAVNLGLFVLVSILFQHRATFFRLNMLSCNGFLAAFNLLPLRFLDGGQLLAIPVERYLPQAATGRVLTVAEVVSVLFLVWLIWVLRSRASVTLLVFLCYAVLQCSTAYR